MTTNEITKPTREQVWAYLLRLWSINDLPTPVQIEVFVHEHALVRLPNNERGQVDRWAAALGMTPSVANRRGWYNPVNDMHTIDAFPGWHFSLSCHLDLDADASAHWSGPAGSADPREQLAAHLVAVAA